MLPRVVKMCHRCHRSAEHYTLANNKVKSHCVLCDNKACSLQRQKQKNSETGKNQLQASQEKYARSPKGKRRASESYQRHKPEFRARFSVRRALITGLLLKPDCCEKCGIIPAARSDGRSGLQAHHYLGYDVEYRLDVQWLCAVCHAATS